ncbi:unnamed protein product [Thlaspi arvense]|uniref:RNase H type-1 domain-containing protein n=1 Tax=Thlaspi arvense TaxID=13288 RepID=A0AAU9RQQ9_THLAR|nr:unnamed protein product [Thlaspi arvense]
MSPGIPPTALQRWTPPPYGWTKCNYYASHHMTNQHSGLGWILRNSQGVFLNGGMDKYQGRYTSEEAECSALIWALQSTWFLGYTKVIFEGDNINIVKLLNCDAANLRLRHYIHTIKSWIAMFSALKFTYRNRLSNQCADKLAKQEAVSESHWSLFYCCPNFLMSFVNNDSSVQ